MTNTSIHTIGTPLILERGETVEARIVFSYRPAIAEPPELEQLVLLEAFALDLGPDADDVTDAASEWLHGIGRDTACNFAQQRRAETTTLARRQRRR
jgi:hypothetical protein